MNPDKVQMRRIRTSFRDFLRDESGVLLAEALILMPILIWGFIALVVYWDVFRVMNAAQKAAYSIGDLLSRQDVPVTEVFIDGIPEILAFLTPGAAGSRLRITSLQMVEGPETPPNPVFDANDDFCLLFSRSNDPSVEPYTQSELKSLAPRIPDMDALDSVVIVETWVDYEPAFDTGVLNAAPGVTDQTFYQFIVTRPRGNARRVTLDGQAFTCT
jgi:hypothetical protein